MRKKQNIVATLLAGYLLLLNIVSVHHSLGDSHKAIESFDFKNHEKITIVHANSQNVLCEICYFFLNQVVFFSVEQTLPFVSSLFNLIQEKPFDIILSKVFTQQLRGPPVFS